MVRRCLVFCLSLLMVAVAPALLPVDWSAAHAKRTRVKTVKAERAAAAKKSEQLLSLQTVAVVTPAAVPSAVPATAWPATITLSTDRPAYKVGDLITVAAVSDAPCDLTLISVDGDGFASVLFPNEFEPDNLMSAGTPKTIPRSDAAYQLRAKAAGTETLLGICAPPGTRPRGIAADYERYRFTLLGNWSDFTTTIEQRETDIIKTAAEEHRKRSRRSPPLEPLLPPSDHSSQARSVLLFEVSEAN